MNNLIQIIFSENSIWRHILISPWSHSYNVFDIWRFNNMCPPLLCCSNESQKWEWKIKGAQRKITRKQFNLKTRYYFLEFSYKHSIHNFCDLPNSCLNYLINRQTLSHAQRTFFRRWLAIFELLSLVFRSWE